MRFAKILFIAFRITFGILGLAKTGNATVIDVNQSFVNFENANSGTVAAVNGNFQYGSAPSTTSLTASDTSIPAFAQYLATEHTDSFGGNALLQGYFQANSNSNPFAFVNTDNASTTTFFGATIGAHEIGMHPDNGGGREYSVVLWTAPSNGTFSDNATFTNRGGNGTTLVYLQDPTGTQNNTTGITPTLTSSGTILAGQTIAFLVGSDNGYINNTTGLTASITFNATAVPEPNAFLLAGIGLFGLIAAACVRGKSP